MKNKILLALWAILYIACTFLGFFPNPGGSGSVIRFLLSLIFFVPGFWLLYEGICSRNQKLLRLLRLISGLSLGLTFLVLLANFFTLLASEAMGNFLYGLLILVSSPMICCGYWALSLFLWACLLIGSLTKGKRKK